MAEKDWTITANRFVAFFDIMGFKEIVERNSHLDVVKKLGLLKEALKYLDSINTNDLFLNTFKIKGAETQSITFSDSIVIFSKGDGVEDACKILLDTAWLVREAIINSIPIKGAVSYGEITVDIKNSLFFGRPIIDAYLLHDQLYLYSAVLDYNSESKIESLKLPLPFQPFIHDYRANLKTGKINHKIVNTYGKEFIEELITSAKKMYKTVSGAPRMYVDNTIEFLNSIV